MRREFVGVGYTFENSSPVSSFHGDGDICSVRFSIARSNEATLSQVVREQWIDFISNKCRWSKRKRHTAR